MDPGVVRLVLIALALLGLLLLGLCAKDRENVQHGAYQSQAA